MSGIINVISHWIFNLQCTQIQIPDELKIYMQKINTNI